MTRVGSRVLAAERTLARRISPTLYTPEEFRKRRQNSSFVQKVLAGPRVLSEQFLQEVRDLPQKNLAIEMLKKLLDDEVNGGRGRTSCSRGRSPSRSRLREYQNRALTTADIIERLIDLAKAMNEASRRGATLGLGEDALAFYDALETNDSAVAILGDETLRASHASSCRR